MSKPLYFVPMIARALQQPDPKEAVKSTLEAIRRLGRQPGYGQGYQQFLRFMAEVRLRHETRLADEEESIVDILTAMMVERATADPTDAPEAIDVGEPEASPWSAEYERLWADLRSVAERPAICEIIIERDGDPIATCSLDPGGGPRSVGGIVPGGYRLVLETGRVLWEGRLDERDLLWTKAFPDRPLPMAADTGEPQREPTRRFDLLEGEIVARVYAGIESGSVEIEVRDMNRRE